MSIHAGHQVSYGPVCLKKGNLVHRVLKECFI